jgi:hypothetical protein
LRTRNRRRLDVHGGRSLGDNDGYILQRSFNEKKLAAKEEPIPADFGMNMPFEGEYRRV